MLRRHTTTPALIGSLLTIAAACTPSNTAAPPESPSAAANGEALTEATAPGTLTSKVLGVMPRGLTTAGVVAHQGSLYVLGGYFGTPHAYSKEYQSTDFSRLDLSTGVWEQLPKVQPIQSAALVSDGRYIYRVGGMEARNDEGQAQDLHSVPDVLRFDSGTGTWSALTPMPEPRSSHHALIVGSTLYVVGGWKLAGDPTEEEWSTTLLRCDLSQPSCAWESSPTPFRARAFGAAAQDGKLFVFGGLTPDEDESKAVFVYDTASGSWSRGPDFPGQSISIRATTWKGSVYANGSDGVVYRLSDDGARFEQVGAYLYPRLFHDLVADDTTGPLVLGGIPSDARGARIRVIEQLSATPPQASVVFRLPAASPAKNRQGVAVAGQQLYAFGGNTGLGQHDFERERFVSSSQRLDLGALQWKELADFPVPRQSQHALFRGGDNPRLLAVGGFGWTDDHLSSQREIYELDPAQNRWSTRAELPVGLSQFGAAEWGDALWVLGGFDYDTSREKNEQIKISSAVLRLDLASDGSQVVDGGFALSEPRRAFAGALLGDRYYVVGGMKDGFQTVISCEAVDLKARSVAAMSCPRAVRIGAELVPLEGKLYLVGGNAQNGEEFTPATGVEVYDPTQDRWSVLTETLPLEETAHLRAFPYRNRILIYTTHHEAKVAELALLDPAAIAAGSAEHKKLVLP